MLQRTPVSILIVNEQAEETKLATIGLRGFFPNCHIDAAYSAEEARALAASQAGRWALLLVDSACLTGSNATLIEDLKHQSLHAIAILLSDKSDSASAIGALQAGADYFLAKHSAAFLTELLFCAREGLEKRALLLSSEHAEVRHRQVIDTLGDVFFELDAEGLFVSVSPSVGSLLGYSAEELVGRSYLTLLPVDQTMPLTARFNERRSGTRSIRNGQLSLRRKQGDPVTVVFSARGLYDSHRRFLGTVGLIHGGGHLDRQGTPPAQESPSSTQPLLEAVDRLSQLARTLETPLSSIERDIQQLLQDVRDLRLEERLQHLMDHTQVARGIEEELAQAASADEALRGAITINDLVLDAASVAGREDSSARFMSRLAPQLPRYAGDRERTVEFFRSLLSYVERYLRAVERNRRVLIETGGAGFPDQGAGTPLFPLAPPHEVVITVTETETECRKAWDAEPRTDTTDLPALSQLIRVLGGTMEVFVPASGPLRIVVHLPTNPTPQNRQMVPPTQPATQPSLEEPSAAPIATDVTRTEPVQEERRHHPRVATTLPAHLRVDSTQREGTLANLSIGGACLDVSADFPEIPQQDVSVVLRTAVGILTMEGTAFSRVQTSVLSERRPSVGRLVIVFKPPQPMEAAILSSMIEAARERSVAFSLEAILTAAPLQAPSVSPPLDQEPSDQERRESLRVALSVSVRLETAIHREPGARLAARTINISRDGACLAVNAPADLLHGTVTLHFAPRQSAGHPDPHEPGTPEAALAATVIWTASNPSAATEFRQDDATTAARIGVRFVSLTPFAERELVRLVRQHISSTPPATSKEVQAVSSVRRECRNQRGQAIAMTDDHLSPAAPELPILIIAPGFGQTAADYCAFAHYAARHRFRVLRYDHTNHVGLSEGELQATTLRGMQIDLGKVAEYVRHTWPTAPVLVMASDLSARAALKMASQADPINILILVNPLLDVKAQLAAIQGHDLVSDYQYGLRRGIANLLGLNINVDAFVADLTAGRLADLQSSLEDIRLLRSSICLVTGPVAESSPLAPSDLPRTVLTALDSRSAVLNLPAPLSVQDLAIDTSHHAAFHQVLTQLSVQLGRPLPPVEPSKVSQAAALHQRRMEREQLRLHYNVSQISRDALAVAYTQQLPQLANVHLYRKLLDDLYMFVGPFKEGMILLDVGLGQSELSRALLVNHAYRTRQRGVSLPTPPVLVATRRSQEMILQAKQHVQALQRELASGSGAGVLAAPTLVLGWIQAEWMRSLPFQSLSIDRIVSNLSLPFVASPWQTLQEWYRALGPNGRLAFTTLHPDSDLSVLYRHHLRLANQDEFGVQPQQVLHCMGRLREAICRGILHSFDHAALGALLRRLPQASFRITPVLEGQAFAVVVEKRVSTGSP